MEKVGTKLRDTPVKSNPWAGDKCEKSDCMVCQSTAEGEPKGDCRVKSTVYHNTCIPCKQSGTLSQYVGETSRATWQRSEEHVKDINSKDTSHMRLHLDKAHPGWENAKDFFRMSVNSYARSAVSRQILEAIQIRNGLGTLNDKKEYSRCLLPSLTTYWKPAEFS